MPDQRWEVDQVQPRLHQALGWQIITSIPCFTLSATHASRRSGATASAFITATRNPCRVSMSSIRSVMSLRAGVRRVDQHPAALHPLRRHHVDEGLLLGVQLLLRQGRHLDDDVAAPGVEDRLPPGAAVRVGQQGLQVGRQQPLGASLQSLRQLQPQLLVHGVVGAALGVARRILLRVHARRASPAPRRGAARRPRPRGAGRRCSR